MASEQALRRRCIRFAKLRGWTHLRLHLGRGAAVGWPDDVFLRRYKRIIFIEFKAPGKTPSPIQSARLLHLNTLGFCARWVQDAEGFDRYVT